MFPLSRWLALSLVTAGTILAYGVPRLSAQPVQDTATYLNNFGYCCDPFAEQNGGWCTPGYPNQSACLDDPAIGGVIYAETSEEALGCAQGCGQQFGLFYCQNPTRTSGEAVCEQRFPSNVPAGTLPYGYITDTDCNAGCVIAEPLEVSTAACRCEGTGTAGKVVCDFGIAAPQSLNLQMPLQDPASQNPPRIQSQPPRIPAGAQTTPGNAPLAADLIAQGVSDDNPFFNTVLTQPTGSPPSTPTTTPTSPSTSTVVVRTWITGGSPVGTTATWVESATFTETAQVGQARQVSPECGATDCNFTVNRRAGVLSVTLNRTDLPRVIGSEQLSYHAQLQAPSASTANSQNPSPSQDASGIYPTERSATIQSLEQCSDRKDAQMSQCRVPSVTTQSQTLPQQRAYVTYTITVPEVRDEPVRVIDNMTYYDSDPYECLETTNLSVQANVLLGPQGEVGTPVAPCSTGRQTGGSCCSLATGQLECFIVPSQSSNTAETYVITVKDIPTKPTEECVDKSIWNQATIEYSASSEATNTTQVTVPSCVLDGCDVCESRTNGAGLTKTECDANTKCSWQGSDSNGRCKRDINICPGYYGCCIESLTASVDSRNRIRLVTGGRSSEGGPEDTTSPMSRNSFTEATSCFGYGSSSSQGGAPTSNILGQWRSATRFTSTELNDMQSRCPSIVRRMETSSSSSSRSDTGSSSSSSSSSSRPHLYCPSDVAQDFTDIPDLDDFENQSLTTGGVVYGRVPMGAELTANWSRYYRKGPVPVDSPAYDGFEEMVDQLRDSRQACMDRAKVGVCLAGNPNRPGTLNCGSSDIDTCVEGLGALMDGGVAGYNECIRIANLVNTSDPAAVAALGMGAAAGQQVPGFVDGFLEGVVDLFGF